MMEDQCPGCGDYHETMEWPITIPREYGGGNAYACSRVCQLMYILGVGE